MLDCNGSDKSYISLKITEARFDILNGGGAEIVVKNTIDGKISITSPKVVLRSSSFSNRDKIITAYIMGHSSGMNSAALQESLDKIKKYIRPE